MLHWLLLKEQHLVAQSNAWENQVLTRWLCWPGINPYFIQAQVPIWSAFPFAALCQLRMLDDAMHGMLKRCAPVVALAGSRKSARRSGTGSTQVSISSSGFWSNEGIPTLSKNGKLDVITRRMGFDITADVLSSQNTKNGFSKTDLYKSILHLFRSLSSSPNQSFIKGFRYFPHAHDPTSAPMFASTLAVPPVALHKFERDMFVYDAIPTSTCERHWKPDAKWFFCFGECLNLLPSSAPKS